MMTMNPANPTWLTTITNMNYTHFLICSWSRSISWSEPPRSSGAAAIYLFTFPLAYIEQNTQQIINIKNTTIIYKQAHFM